MSDNQFGMIQPRLNKLVYIGYFDFQQEIINLNKTQFCILVSLVLISLQGKTFIG